MKGITMNRDQIAEYNENALFADGFDEALLGYVEVFGKPPLACYDRAKCIEIIRAGMDADGTLEEADEYFEFNILGAYVGENTPCFLTTKGWFDENTTEIPEICDHSPVVCPGGVPENGDSVAGSDT